MPFTHVPYEQPQRLDSVIDITAHQISSVNLGSGEAHLMAMGMGAGESVGDTSYGSDVAYLCLDGHLHVTLAQKTAVVPAGYFIVVSKGLAHTLMGSGPVKFVQLTL